MLSDTLLVQDDGLNRFSSVWVKKKFLLYVSWEACNRFLEGCARFNLEKGYRDQEIVILSNS